MHKRIYPTHDAIGAEEPESELTQSDSSSDTPTAIGVTDAMERAESLILVPTTPSLLKTSQNLRSLSQILADLKFGNAMTDEEVLQLQDWAQTRMAWERAYAKAEGKRITSIKGGKTLNQRVQEALTSDPTERGWNFVTKRRFQARAAVKLIEEAIQMSYKTQETV